MKGLFRIGKEIGRRFGAGLALTVGALCTMLLAACSVERTDPIKIEDISYTILEESQIPEELRALIEEKKAQRFQVTFDTGNDRYIAVGYGTQATGGYSISVEELYLSTNAIYLNTNLIGPLKGEPVTEAESYPYLVLKLASDAKYLKKSVVFE